MSTIKELSVALRKRSRNYPAPVSALAATLAGNLKLYEREPNPALRSFLSDRLAELERAIVTMLTCNEQHRHAERENGETKMMNYDKEAAILINDLDSMGHRIEALQANVNYTSALVVVQRAKELVQAGRSELHQAAMAKRFAKHDGQPLDPWPHVSSGLTNACEQDEGA